MVRSEPSDSAAIDPLAVAFLVFGVEEQASAVLLPVEPLTSVKVAVGPEELAVARLLAVDEMTNVLSSVCPGERANAMHFVVFPNSLVFGVVWPCVETFAVEGVHVEVPRVGVPV